MDIIELLTPASRYWTAPFRYDGEGAMIFDANNARIIDVRGWGHLTGNGSHGIDEGAATLVQDQLGEGVALLLNAHWPVVWHKETMKTASMLTSAQIKERKGQNPFRAVAQAIARDLFTDGSGKLASRLVMKHGHRDQERDGAGWCEAAVVDRIADHLARASTAAAPGND